MLIRRLARPLLATAFVVDGVDTLLHPAPRAKAAAALVSQGERRLSPQLAAKLPADPAQVVRINAATQVGAGVLLALGRVPRLAALVLASTVVPATVTEQDFWNEPDPDRRAAKQVAFLKDLGLLGGLMITAADTAGKPSLGWRGRRAAHRVAATLPLDTGTGDALRDQLQQQAIRARDLAQATADKGAKLVETHGPTVLEAAKRYGSELAELAHTRSAELAELAQVRGAELADAARHRGAAWTDIAKQRGAELAEIAQHRGAELAETARHHGAHWADTARQRAAELTDAAQQRGTELAGTARRRGTECA
jgi:uncharacterized membrane protein YphA (DoxX/SURF4 family)